MKVLLAKRSQLARSERVTFVDVAAICAEPGDEIVEEVAIEIDPTIGRAGVCSTGLTPSELIADLGGVELRSPIELHVGAPVGGAARWSAAAFVCLTLASPARSRHRVVPLNPARLKDRHRYDRPPCCAVLIFVDSRVTLSRNCRVRTSPSKRRQRPCATFSTMSGFEVTPP